MEPEASAPEKEWLFWPEAAEAALAVAKATAAAATTATAAAKGFGCALSKRFVWLLLSYISADEDIKLCCQQAKLKLSEVARSEKWIISSLLLKFI